MKPNLIVLFRAGVFAGILVCLHYHHERLLGGKPEEYDAAPLLLAVQETIPEAATIRMNPGDGSAELLDADEQPRGQLLLTSPACDHILGFSGPTSLLLVFRDDRLTDFRILSSRDTHEHVEQIRQDQKFTQALIGRPRRDLIDLRDVDAVSGATLSSYAILESIRLKVLQFEESSSGTTTFGAAGLQPPVSLRFPEPPRMDDVRILYPDATGVRLRAGSRMAWEVLGPDGVLTGQLLRASPIADNVIGYQGPTDVLIAIDAERRVTGIAPGVSYDNEPYTGYIREDEYFRRYFRDQPLSTLVTLDAERVEGVSGATMTSQAMARSLQLTAQAYVDEQRAERPMPSGREGSASRGVSVRRGSTVGFRELSTIGLTLGGLVLGLTRLRGRRRLRLVYQGLMIGWLGLINGDLVSQAFLLGWAQSGIPWRNALGLTCLTAAALIIPVTTGHNLYCSHICPHGAVQQLTRNWLKWRISIPFRISRYLRWIPGILLACIVGSASVGLRVSAVHFEPFDAWLWPVAGAISVAIALGGLLVSLFVPMAYCRFGCPTGTLLDYLSRSGGRSFNRRDLLAVALLLLSCAALMLPQ